MRLNPNQHFLIRIGCPQFGASSADGIGTRETKNINPFRNTSARVDSDPCVDIAIP